MNHIAILDFGSQYAHLITKRIRELNVLAKIYPHDIPASELKEASGIILSGGPQSVFDKNSLQADKKIFDLKIPVLGLCYGHQFLAHVLGGKVKPGKIREYGPAQLAIQKSPIFKNVSLKNTVWMSHGDSVIALPKNFRKIGATSDCAVAAMACEDKKIYGFQFHPEVDHSVEGVKMIRNFVLQICKAEPNWKIDNIIADIKKDIRKKVGSRKVIVLVSGGVDSNVAFTLLTKTLGKKRVTGLYIDTGFMRQNESDEIIKNYKKIGLDNLEVINASDKFYKKLENIFEPEEKRRIIGQEFLIAKKCASQKLKLNPKEWLLGQGTIYPDIIESGGTKNADKIKTHHNRVDAIRDMLARGLIIEPLADFYKFEVRQIGRLLKLPPDLINRHPFPGPGLAIRCLCHDKNKTDKKFKAAQAKVNRLYEDKFKKIKQSLLPIKSVGVQGDNRTYAHPLVVWNENNWKKLDKIANYTTNALKEVNRVLLLLSKPKTKPVFRLPETSLDLNKNRIETLREVDAIIMKIIQQEKLYDKIWQFPVVLVPITDETGRESIVLRPIVTRDAMTLHFAEIEKRILNIFVKEILKTKKISHIFYDITNKPPGTIEWE